MKNTNPFPGLRPYLPPEWQLFFAREEQVESMVDRLARTHFLTVIGLSGSGKTSLVSCGLRPALNQGRMAGAGSDWRVAQFRPANNPIAAMAGALAAEGVLYDARPEGRFSSAELIESTLRMSRLGLVDAWRQARRGPGTNLLVVVDQFEELFRYQEIGTTADRAASNVADDEHVAFVNRLLAVRDDPSLSIYVVLTMRSDFLGESAQIPGLPEAINEAEYLVPRLTREERKRAIAEPIRAYGAEISPVLLTRLVNDVGDNSDQLSLLQHALNRTWAEWEKEGSHGPIDLRHYNAIGTMANALDQHAEKAYGELATERQRTLCEKLFKALTDKATDARGIRRPCQLAKLCEITGATEAELEKVLAVFRKPSRSFLMPPEGEALHPDTVIDVSHESLMRIWKRLRIWLDEEAQSAFGYRRLAETAALHENRRANLWRGRELEDALRWRERVRPTAAWAERYAPGYEAAIRFLDRSVAARSWKRGGALVAVFVAILVLGSFAVTRWREREAERASAARAREEQLVSRLEDTRRTAVDAFATTPAETLDPQQVEQRFAALTRIGEITQSTTPEQHAAITIEYYRKPGDARTLVASLENLGFNVETLPPNNTNPTNCIWHGSQVPEIEVKLVAYALIRAGFGVVGIQPLSPDQRHKPKVIQVGHNVRLEEETPITPEAIDTNPVRRLYRRQAAITRDVEGVVVEFDATTLEGKIASSEGDVYFGPLSHPPSFRVGERVRFVMFSGSRRKYAHAFVRLGLSPSQPAPVPSRQ
ncbi:MAG TPA: hypothetical protein VE974_23400 [Thermoanaerobaculia bacterium]|nr:hypothetical protein [Thermoanaerobaculia bacterium]